MDFQKLLSQGVPGLTAEIEQKNAAATGPEQSFYKALLETVSIFKSGIRAYENQFLVCAAIMGDDPLRGEYEQIASILNALASRPPATLREAMQLFWLYTLFSGTWNFGRMDVYLGPFLKRDLDSGLLSEREALARLQLLWRFMKNGRV